MMEKTGTQLTDQKKICSRSSTMSNAEIKVDKKVDKITPKNKQSPSSSPSPSGKIKTMQRSDLGIKKSPLQINRTRSATSSVRDDETNLIKLRKVKSDSAKAVAQPDTSNSKSDDETVVAADSNVDLGINKSRFEVENQVKKAITENAHQIPPPPPPHLDLDIEEEKDEEVEKEEEEEEVEKEVEVEKRSLLDIKDKLMSLQEQEEPKNVVIEKKKLLPSKDRSPPLTVTPAEKKKLLPSNDRSPRPTVTPIEKKITPAVTIQEKISPNSDDHHGTSSRLQSLGDLIMWRDVSRSAFVFGIGTFAIISSSYTKDLNISCISVLSYLGLVYLALSFIFRSILNRGSVDMESRDEEYVVGEEEAIWLVKLVLPYLNEFLSKLRSLFSGDPATTIKLAVLLFILARCGGSITIWKMTKLGFFGVFMVPKLYSSYSSQIAAYGTFWFDRFGDAWESCSHKKAVAFGIFSLVWNMSSIIARIWTIFLLFVAYRYYQQYRAKEEGYQDEESSHNSYSQYRYRGELLQARKSNPVDIKKQKTVC